MYQPNPLETMKWRRKQRQKTFLFYAINIIVLTVCVTHASVQLYLGVKANEERNRQESHRVETRR